MRALSVTFDELRLACRPYVLFLVYAAMGSAAFLWGLAAAALGDVGGAATGAATAAFMVGLLWAYAGFEEAVFDRKAGVVRLFRRSVLGRSMEVLPLDKVSGVLLQTNVGMIGSRVVKGRRPALRLGYATEVPLTRPYRHDGTAEEAVAEIASWLAWPERLDAQGPVG